MAAQHKNVWEAHDSEGAGAAAAAAAGPPSGRDSPDGRSGSRDAWFEDFPYIMQWDDSGALETLTSAQKRRDARAKGLPWTSYLSDPDLYLEKITWDVRESWDLPDSADRLAAKEERRPYRSSRSRGGRNSGSGGRWRNQQEVRDHEYRSHHEVAGAHHRGTVPAPVQDVWSSDKNVPLSFADPFPIRATGWGDVAVDKTGGGVWADAMQQQLGQASPSMPSQSGPSGWPSSAHYSEDNPTLSMSLGWGGDQPARLQLQQQQVQQPFQYERQQPVWTAAAAEWSPAADVAKVPQHQHQQMPQQQQARSQFVDIRWQQADTFAGQQHSVHAQQQAHSAAALSPCCGDMSETCSHEPLPTTLQQHNFQNRSNAGGQWNYGNGPGYGWDGGGDVENRIARERASSREFSSSRGAPPPAQDVWKQQWQPVANIGARTGIYY